MGESSNVPEAADAKGRVMVVDDEPQVRAAFSRILQHAGYQVEAFEWARGALERLKTGGEFDLILSDLRMPEIDGIEFLKSVRGFDLDVPLVITTGDPSLESAIATVQFGGFRYLPKPVEAQELVEAVRSGVAMHRLAVLKRTALEVCKNNDLALGDRASLELYFDRALRALWMAFQPIIDTQSARVFGYEALVRSSEPMLPHPGALFDAAERLGRLRDLGRAIRTAITARVPELPRNTHLFVNLHPADLNDPELYEPSSPFAPYADRIVLEITERASLDGIEDVGAKIEKLRSSGYDIAVDDLGAGYAGLATFGQLEPDIVKLDMSLIRGIDTSSSRQSIVRSLVEVCTNDLGTQVVCEGIETPEERDTVLRCGARLLQGFLFGRPDPAFASPTF